MELCAYIYTLGCRVNTCESLSLADMLKARGYTILPKNSNKTPDAVVVNTCAVTSESARKSRQAVRRFRQRFPDAIIAAAGCAVQTDGEIPEADIICGTAEKQKLADIIASLGKARPENQIKSITDIDSYRICDSAVYSTPYKSRCHIKIEDGCDSRCAYCIIPSLRGRVRSKAPDELLCEINERISEGAKEIVLTGIETGAYGKDLKNTSLIDILEAADKISGLYLMRLGSMDPACFTDEFIARVAKLEHFEKHIHLSVQSGCSKTLAAMKRKYNAEYLENRIEKLYSSIDGLMLTADMITGFPGETDEDFRTTAEFAKKAKFLHMHIFPYSEREGTVAATMSGSVPVSVRKERAAELERINAECKHFRLQSAVGKLETVHFETKKGELNTGYTKSYMPVRVRLSDDLKGRVCKVRIDGVDEQNKVLCATYIGDEK